METKKEHGLTPVKIGKTHPRWNSKLFSSTAKRGTSSACPRNEKGKKDAETKPKKYLVMPQPETKPRLIRDFAFIESYTPTPETLEQATARNLELYEVLTPEQEKKLSTNLQEPLKFPYPVDFKIRTYEKSLIIAKRRSEIIFRGRLIRRTIKQVDTTPPDYESFKVSEGYTYRFYFRNNATHKTVIRDIKTNRHRVHPTREIFYPKPDGTFKAVKVYLPLNKIVQLTPKKSIIYEIELKQGCKIHTDLIDQPIRTHAKTLISIDYKQLARAEKRVSKKWFNLLLKSLKDETLVSELTPHLKKLRSKIITSRAITPNTLRSQKPITPRINTVENYNHQLRIGAVTSKLRQETRQFKKVKK